MQFSTCSSRESAWVCHLFLGTSHFLFPDWPHLPSLLNCLPKASWPLTQQGRAASKHFWRKSSCCFPDLEKIPCAHVLCEKASPVPLKLIASSLCFQRTWTLLREVTSETSNSKQHSYYLTGPMLGSGVWTWEGLIPLYFPQWLPRSPRASASGTRTYTFLGLVVFSVISLNTLEWNKYSKTIFIAMHGLSLSLVAASRAPRRWGARASHFLGFSCSAQGLEQVGFSCCGTWA